MLISKEVEVNITNVNIKYYREKGYDVSNKILKVKVEDLPIHTSTKVKVKCVNCGTIKEIQYDNYLKQISSGDYYCCNCQHIKTKIILKQKYNVTSTFYLPSVREKINNTMMQRYGTTHALCSDKIKNKMKNDLKEKYNVDNVSKIKDVKKAKVNTLSKTWLDRIMKKHPNLNIVGGDYDKQILTLNCDCGKVHTFGISYDLLHNRMDSNSILCTKCNKISRNTFSLEDKFINYIKTFYNGKIIKNYRKTIKPYELDIYLPDLNLAFEFNGLKWHNETKCDENYHKMKYEMCKNKNIELIQFFGDEWCNKFEQLKSMIMISMKCYDKKIDINKCKVEKINIEDTNEFILENDILDNTAFNYSYGLKYKNKLVSIVTLNKTNNELHINRFCNKLYTCIDGSFEKIIEYIKTDLIYDKITLKLCNNYYDYKIYESCNFKFIGDVKPSYTYTDSRKTRISIDELNKNICNLNIDKKQYITDKKLTKIYNSGYREYIIKKE